MTDLIKSADALAALVRREMGHYDSPEGMMAALTAYLQARESADGVKVKPLVWEQSWAWGLDLWTAESFEISHSKEQGWWVKGGTLTPYAPTDLEAAKAAAQADYEARIKATLED